MHQNEWFQNWFFKNFLGRGWPNPLPRPLSRFFSGFALGSGFALNSRALRALDSGFALDTRALRALDSGFALNFRLGTLVWPPKINSWIRPAYRQTLRQDIWRHSEFPFVRERPRSTDSQRSTLLHHTIPVVGKISMHRFKRNVQEIKCFDLCSPVDCVRSPTL